MQGAAYAAAGKTTDGTTDNDIYGLDDSDQWKSDEVPEKLSSTSFDDIEDDVLADETGLLVKLGIVSTTDGKARPEDELTRYEFASALAAITNSADYIPKALFNDLTADDERYSAMGYAYENGFLSRFSDLSIRPEKSVSGKEAVQAFVKLMQYSNIADAVSNGGIDGYLKVAKDIKLLGSLAYSDAPVSRADAFGFIYNALTIQINNSYGVDYYSAKKTYELQYEKREDKTLLSVYHDIYKSEGKVTATVTSGIEGFGTVEKDEMVIDGKKYKLSDIAMLDFFGYNVEYYYKDTKSAADCGELVYLMKEGGVKYLTVKSDNITSYKSNVLTYTDGGKEKRATVKKSFNLIRNGKAAGSLTEDEVLPANGTVTLVANGGSVYDTMIVWDYYNAVVKSFTSSDGKLKFTFDYDIPSLEYDPEEVVIDLFEGSRRMDTKITVSYYYDGDGVKQMRVNMPNIPKESLVSIFADTVTKSKNKLVASNDAKYLKVVVNTKVADGTLAAMSSFGGEQRLYISKDDKAVRFAVSPDNFFDKNEKGLEVGSEGKFFCDFLGKIASYRLTDGTLDMKYGYLIDAMATEGLRPKLIAKILTTDSEVITPEATDKLKINGASAKSAANAKTLLSNSAKLINPSFTVSQVVKYRQNSAGELTELETVTASLGVGSGYDKNHLRRDKDKSSMVFLKGWGNAFVERENVDYFESTGEKKNMRIEMTHYLGAPKIFFCVPDAETLDDDEVYSATNAWPSESSEWLTTEIYDANRYNTPGIAVVYAKMQNSYLARPIMVVDRVSVKTDSKGNSKKTVTGYVGTGGYAEYPANKDDVYDGVKQGDVIIVSGKNGVAYEIEKLGNVLDFAKTDISSAPLMIKSKNKAPETDYYLYSTLYEAYDFDESIKSIIVQNGALTGDGEKREYQRNSWWVDEWRNWGGAVTADVDTQSGKIWLRNGTYGDIKTAVGYSNASASKILLLETYGYGMRFVVIINEK